MIGAVGGTAGRGRGVLGTVGTVRQPREARTPAACGRRLGGRFRGAAVRCRAPLELRNETVKRKGSL